MRHTRVIWICTFVTMLVACALLGEHTAMAGVYHYPEIEPCYAVRAGYRFAGLDGSSRAAEYEHIESTPYMGFKAVLFPFPSRMYFEIDAVGSQDYFVDLGYAHGDRFVSRWVRKAVYHNLDDIEIDPAFGVDRRHGDEDFAVRTTMDNVSLRGKPLKFPLHVYVNVDRTEQDGIRQQRFIDGTYTRATEERDIDWMTENVTVGMNSHLGPVEIDYSHSEKRFRPSGDDVMSETYFAAELPHNVFSETEGSTDTVMLHTSYTGRVVASITLSRTERENTTSEAEATHTLGQGEVTIVPSDKASLVLKYRKQKTEAETPDELPENYLGFSDYTAPIPVVRENISATEDMYSGLLNYHISRDTHLALEHRRSNTSREDAEGWGMPDETSERETTVTVRTRLPKHMKLRARYRHLEADDPAYNTSPERADSGMVHLDILPASRFMATIIYNYSLETRSSLEFEGAEAEDREVRRNGLTAHVTYAFGERSNMYASYAYMKQTVKQDLYYDTQLSTGVEYEDSAQSYSIGIEHATKSDITLSAGAARTVGKSGFDENGLDSFSELEVAETRYELGAAYNGERFGYSVQGRYFDFDDKVENDENPALEDGSAYTVLVSLSAKF